MADGPDAAPAAPGGGAPEEPSPWRVLVQLADPALADLVGGVLRSEGWSVWIAGDPAEAVATAAETQPDVVLVDAGPDGSDPVAVLSRVRATHALPALLITGPGDGRRMPAVTAGGDDDLRRPFSAEELTARVRALLRGRGGRGQPPPHVFQVGDLVLDEVAREVRRGGEELHLTATEFDLLRLLVRHPRRVMSKVQILDRVWHYDFDGNPNVVELYISYLRRKLDADREPMIHTLRGVGYAIRPVRGAGEQEPTVS
ncbi:DNA-binding response regulator [Litorihabitans aurantiacus]|uniref:DNA-binding response regulator n=1 Tax=Litorihabitans aurantiacus TaxID=1930061 RepID=A0AA37XFF8_9MICO|nr:DNA-binding response regulator [Litorihabitans aurantiacus]